MLSFGCLGGVVRWCLYFGFRLGYEAFLEQEFGRWNFVLSWDRYISVGRQTVGNRSVSFYIYSLQSLRTYTGDKR